MEKPKFLSLNGVRTLVTYIKENLATKVDKEPGKSLSDNNFSDEDVTKLESIEPNSQENLIESISVNGTSQTINNKNVDIAIPLVDDTLTNAGQSADAKAVGDILTDLQIKDLSDRLAKGTGTNAIIEGTITGDYTNRASGNNSHAEGFNSEASGSSSHAEGSQTTASGSQSHSEGGGTIASGDCSHSEGSTTTASGLDSHAEGGETTASGQVAHSEGARTIAAGNASHSEGGATIANGRSQHVFGEYNIAEQVSNPTTKGTYIEIVGNGVSNEVRSNARTLDWNGNEVIAGKLTVGAAPTDTMDVSTKGYVDTLIADEFNASNSYSKGDYVINGGKLYRFTADHSTGAFDGTDAVEVIVTDEIKNTIKIPNPPTTDGSYVLTAVVNNGEPTYSWLNN